MRTSTKVMRLIGVFSVLLVCVPFSMSLALAEPGKPVLAVFPVQVSLGENAGGAALDFSEGTKSLLRKSEAFDWTFIRSDGKDEKGQKTILEMGCMDIGCRLKAAKKLGATKALFTKVEKGKATCATVIEQYDVPMAYAEARSKKESSCSEEHLEGALDESIIKLFPDLKKHRPQPAAGSPPEPSVAPWFIYQGGTKVGPLTIKNLKKMIIAGLVGARSKAWRAGMSDWKEVGSIEDLKDDLTRPVLLLSSDPETPMKPVQRPVAPTEEEEGEDGEEEDPGPSFALTLNLTQLLVYSIASPVLGAGTYIPFHFDLHKRFSDRMGLTISIIYRVWEDSKGSFGTEPVFHEFILGAGPRITFGGKGLRGMYFNPRLGFGFGLGGDHNNRFEIMIQPEIGYCHYFGTPGFYMTIGTGIMFLVPLWQEKAIEWEGIGLVTHRFVPILNLGLGFDV